MLYADGSQSTSDEDHISLIELAFAVEFETGADWPAFKVTGTRDDDSAGTLPTLIKRTVACRCTSVVATPFAFQKVTFGPSALGSDVWA